MKGPEMADKMHDHAQVFERVKIAVGHKDDSFVGLRESRKFIKIAMDTLNMLSKDYNHKDRQRPPTHN